MNPNYLCILAVLEDFALPVIQDLDDPLEFTYPVAGIFFALHASFTAMKPVHTMAQKV